MNEDIRDIHIQDQFDAATNEVRAIIDKMVEARGDELHKASFPQKSDNPTLFQQRLQRWVDAIQQYRISMCSHVNPYAPQPVFGSIALIDYDDLVRQGIEIPDWLKEHQNMAILGCVDCMDELIEVTIDSKFCDGCGRESEGFHEATINMGPIMLFGNICDECMRENDYPTE